MIMSVAAILIFYILSFFAGIWGDIILGRLRAKSTLSFRLSFGGCSVLLLGILICAVMPGTTSPGLCISIAGIIVAAAIAAGFVIRRRMNVPRTGFLDNVNDIKGLIYPAVIVLSVIVLAAAVGMSRFENTGAMKGIGSATYVYENGQLGSADPMMLLIGVISCVLRIHPLDFIYSVSPAIFIPLYCLCYASVIDAVFGSTGKRVVAYLIVIILDLWGYQSEALIGVTLLVRWFGAGVFAVHGLLSLAQVILAGYLKNKPESARDDMTVYEDAGDEEEEWDMKKHKIVNARNLAIGLGLLAAALVVFVYVLNNKINKLYDATVNLQTDLSSRCSIYEFAPGGGDTEGYLIKGSDGTVVFIGGGGKQNADELSEFFEKYGNSVTKWYVYGEDEEDSGAMRHLIDSDAVDIGNIYVIDAKELTGLQ